jgi:hypothetical protein
MPYASVDPEILTPNQTVYFDPACPHREWRKQRLWLVEDYKAKNIVKLYIERINLPYVLGLRKRLRKFVTVVVDTRVCQLLQKEDE